MKTRINALMSHQIVKYGMATGLSACFTLLLPIILHEAFHISAETAVGISLTAAFFVNFLTTRYYVFESRGSKQKEIILFIGASLFFRGFEYVLFLVLHNYLDLYYMAALLIVLAISIVFKFIVYKFVIFKPLAGDL